MNENKTQSNIVALALGWLRRVQQDTKSVQELHEGYKEGRAADKERSAVTTEAPGTSSGGETPFNNPNDPTR